MRKLFRVSLGLLWAVLALTISSYADTVTITPSVTSVSVGQLFSVDVAIENASDLYAFQFDLGFDPAIVKAVSVDDVSFLADSGDNFPYAGDIDNGSGSITNIYDTLLAASSGATGSGLLATITFEAIGAGTGSFNFLNAQFLDSILDPIEVNLQGARYIVSENTEVPEPSTILLLSGGLLSLAAIARRRR
jgi:hypothetical protein